MSIYTKMLLIGGVVWLVYLFSVNLLTFLLPNVYHLYIEWGLIPLSWILNYSLNAQFNFYVPDDDRFNLKQFSTFCLISSIGWIGFSVVSFIAVDLFGFQELYASILSMIGKTLINLKFQPEITFKFKNTPNQ